MAPTKVCDLNMDIERQAAMTIVRCVGQVDVHSLAKFSEAIRGLVDEGKPVRVDLKIVRRVDSSGIGAFVALWTAAHRKNCDLKYINPSKQVEETLRITALLGMVEGHDAEEQQLATAFNLR